MKLLRLGPFTYSLALFSMLGNKCLGELDKFASLKNARLIPIRNGAIAGTAIIAQEIWNTNPVLVFVTRRPGWVLCREEAKDLSDLFAQGKFPGVKLISVIKEIAPTTQAATDEILGVGEFQSNYFKDYPVYLNEGKEFYSYLGNKSLFKQKLWTWNPFALYTSFKNLGTRLKEKKIDGNMVGEGLIQGGVLLISPTEGVVYSYNEATGYELPLFEISEAIYNLLGTSSSAAAGATSSDTEVCHTNVALAIEADTSMCSMKSAKSGASADCGCSATDKK